MPRLYIDGEWREVVNSSNFPIINLSKSYKSQYLEGALEEIATWNNKSLEKIATINTTLTKHKSDIDYLKEHGGGGSGGGGGGTTLPTITTTTESPIIIDPDANLEVSVFFSSPNLGEGLAYILFDDAEVDTIKIKQGNNVLNLGKMTNLQTKVSVYVRDRSQLMSNMISWTVISGGIDLTLNFDYEADYMIGDEIFMDYEISSATSNPVKLKINIDGDNYEQDCEQGFNSYDLSELSVGVHVIKIFATDGTYTSKTYEFNVVVINSDSLYLSTTFKGGKFDYGVPIMVNYRISDGSLRKFEVKLYLDDKIYKTLSSSRGSYYWTITDMAIGNHTFKIEVNADDDHKVVEGSFTVVEGDYTPLSINKQGLVFRLDPSTKTNQDEDRANPTFNGVGLELHGFNFSSNGWVDGELVCDGGAYGIIDYSPWADNATRGSTIEIYYKCSDIGMDQAKVIDYSDTKSQKGFSVGLDQCSMRSIANTGIGFVNPDKYIKVSFVIDRNNKFAHVYINGVCSRSFQLNDSGSGVGAIYEDFSHDGKIYINCDSLMANIGSCRIKDILIYRRALSKDEILKNTLAYELDMSVQKINYNFEFNNSTLSKMKMYGSTEGMSLYQANTMRLKYESANTEKYGQSFDLPYCLVQWQGTSSIGYSIKNYQATLRDTDMKEYLYTPYPNGIPESIFCFKADYMESSHGRNAGIAKFLNDCVFTIKNPAQLKDSRVRNAINGFPMLMYINDELIGIYNFNTDRYSAKTYGYEDEEKTLVYEIAANSDSTAGAFFKYTGSGDPTAYYKADFMCLYPPTRAAGNDNFTEIKSLVEWVHDASDEEFKENFEKHFNKKYVLRYLIYVNLMGAVDSLGKNMKLASWDGGNIWYIQPYDCDTTIGLDNSGDLRFGSDIEIGEADTFNTTASKLWEKVMRVFEEDIKAEYAELRRTTLTLENMYKYILDEQINKIPKYYYNRDMENKYLKYPTWIYALHGDAGSFIEQWLKDRLLYVDTMYDYNASTADFVTLRASKFGNVYVDIQTFCSMYFTIKWTNKAGDTQKLRVKKGETVRFKAYMSTATDQEVIVYGGKYIKSLGDLSNMQPATLSLGNATRLTKLVCHSEKLYNTDISKCSNLTELDLSDCTQLGSGASAQPILNVSNCANIQSVNCKNTQITEVQLNPKGSNIKELILSKTIQTITLNNCPNLNVVELEDGHNVKNVEITDCPELKFGASTSANLSGIVKLSLNNSCNNLREIVVQDTSNLSEMNIYNNDSIEKIRLGVQVFNDTVPYTHEKAQSGENITIKTIRATALKELIITGYGRQSSSDFELPTRPANSPVNRNKYDTFICNNLDISQSTIESVSFLAASLIYNLKVPITLKNLRCNSYYDNVRTAWNGLEGINPTCIFNLYNPDNITVDSEQNIWDLTALKINDFDIYNICTEDKCLVTMKNISAKCVNYPLSFNCHTTTVSPQGVVDYSEYKGTTLEYAFSNSSSDSLQIILPESFETVENFTKAFYNCRQNWSWNNVATIISNAPKIKKIGDFTFAKANLTNSETVSFKSTNRINIGQNLFEESNLNNITEFNFPNGIQVYDDAYDYGIFNRSNLVTIGDITLNTGRLKYLFMRSQNLFSIGNINIANNPDTSAELMCGYCSKLQKIGTVRTSNIEVFNNAFRECTQLQKLELDVSKAVTMDYMCYGDSALSTIILNNLDKNTTLSTMNYSFFRCVAVQAITGGDLLPSSITSTRSAYMNCNSLKKAPMLPATLTGYLVSNYMCYSTAITRIGNLPERLTSGSYMFRNTAIEDETIVLPSTITSASYMFSSAAAKTLNINIPAGCNDIQGILDSATCEIINLNMEDPSNVRSIVQFIGSNNPNLIELNNLNLYNSKGLDYIYCPNLNVITFTNNSEIIDSLNVANTKLNLTTIEKIINILWDATGWEEYEEITQEDGTVIKVKKVKTLLLGSANMNTLKNSPRGSEILAIGVNKNWTISA